MTEITMITANFILELRQLIPRSSGVMDELRDNIFNAVWGYIGESDNGNNR